MASGVHDVLAGIQVLLKDWLSGPARSALVRVASGLVSLGLVCPRDVLGGE